ncbi:esterase [Streptomyces olivaceoviridis]|uniref:alpha/beta hydrolase n=1 Tax=Streptomyces olivaceoviridis TaxID=1921 RepID=UPI001671DBBD|nr:alpha/beta hydrolase [Streptomyces olivaceoviridis]GGZ09541.1 esterase [Streptomyces olivaceoviridis]
MSHGYDPELAPWVDLLPDVDFAELERVRRVEAEIMEFGSYDPPAPVDVRDTVVPALDGAPEVGVRVYRPVDRDGTLPGILYVHGGGFAIGSVDAFHGETTRIAAEVGAVVVSVKYRLAPEHPFPAALEDCYAALSWMAARAGELGMDRGRIAVAGESSGAGVAAAVALYARDQGGPALRMQYLGVPVLDDRLDTLSMRTFTDTPGWSLHNAQVTWDYYLGGEGIRGGENVSPYASPARAEHLDGLPPTYISAAEFDPVRDEDLAYAQRLVAAGVLTEVHLFSGTFHGSTRLAPQAGVSRRIVAEQMPALRRGLGVEEDESRG